MYGHLEMRAMGMLMSAASGVPLQKHLSSPQVAWLQREGLVTDQGELTEAGRLMAHHGLVSAEIQLQPRQAVKCGEGT